MPLLNYGVLKGQVSSVKIEPEDTHSPHVQIILDTAGRQAVASVNVKSRAGATERDKWLLFHVSADFRHPITEALPALAPGFHRLPLPALRGLDYVRQNLVRREKMRPLPPESMDGGEDLNEALVFYLEQAKRRSADCYVFGETMRDYRTGLVTGVHDVHYNQGSPEHGPYAQTNGTYQDGGLLLHHPHTGRWVALLLAFQDQLWHTDDTTGHPLLTHPLRRATYTQAVHLPDGAVRIISARLASDHPATVTLLNATTETIPLDNWQLRDAHKTATVLHGVLPPEATRVFRLHDSAVLHPRGGYVSLLDAQGWKVDGVSYTASKVSPNGTIVF